MNTFAETLAYAAAIGTIVWPHAIAREPPPLPPHITVAGFPLLMLARPHRVLPHKPRTIEAILRDPLGP